MEVEGQQDWEKDDLTRAAKCEAWDGAGRLCSARREVDQDGWHKKSVQHSTAAVVCLGRGLEG